MNILDKDEIARLTLNNKRLKKENEMYKDIVYKDDNYILQKVIDLKKENGLLKEAVEEMRIDIINNLENEYPKDLREKHPSYKKKYDNNINWLDGLIKDNK